MMDSIYPYILTIITGVLGFQIQRLIKSISEEKQRESHKQRAADEALCCLLRVKLIEYHERYTKEGSIPSFGYENFMLMYRSYHALGGNGMIDQMHEEIKKLKLKGR